MAWGVRGRIQEIKKSLAPRRFQNVSKPSLHYGKKTKKKIHKKVVREEVYSDWVSNPDIIGHFIK